LLLETKRALFAAAGILAATAIAIYLSEHETSKLALPTAMLVFVVARLSWKLALGLLAAGWITATLLIVPLSLAAFSNNLHLAHWIPETGRNRIILWSYTADQWRKAPILGVGVDSTKEIDDKRAPTAVKPDGFTYPLRTGRHAHNIYMQTWYELGAVGAVLLLGLGLAGLGAIARLSTRIRPYAMASFATGAVVGAFGWGLWQVWLLALFGLGVLLVGVADVMERRQSS
jgi:O-antigen ligase